MHKKVHSNWRLVHNARHFSLSKDRLFDPLRGFLVLVVGQVRVGV